jgi:hypothetical protein
MHTRFAGAVWPDRPGESGICRAYADHGFLTLGRSFFRPAGRKNDLQKKESSIKLPCCWPRFLLHYSRFLLGRY